MALIGSSLAWAPTASAHGDTESVLCTGHEDGYSSPSLGLLPRPTRIHARAQYTCSGAAGRNEPATGTFEGSSPAASCIAADNPTGREVIRYADGRTSIINYDSSTTLRVAGLNVVRLNGEVTKGPGKGLRAHRTLATLADGAATECLIRTSVHHAPGGVQLEIGTE
ncbi:hypothetical protein H340_18309 [Streptomyces mobaraensis NBRC 13819 = DSM 40847]|uniref:Uncharacterized protein n=2 Tax=Streptomyces mobaraensis TaxID=35621 RepID=M3C545_STRM1|nr:hypothetical protein H340_18309 [Streptomyces mobaraensis NBRC 13819 = DSM 40847]